ncbi:MAG: hypothetical protein M0P74_07660 [Syntrophales bacterium]|jgi:hypothetical protein|nr:hypothetical protein [Syntrophales bacterium]
MNQKGEITQPLLGILGTAVVFFIAFGIITWFKPETFIPWAGELAMCLIPFSIIIGMVWKADYPAPAAKLEQPLKGLYLLLLNMIVGSVVAAWSIKTVGGFVTPPTPPLIFFTIMTVIMTFWCVVVWGCWPASGIKGDHPAFVGFGTLIVAYALSWILFKTLFNFDFMNGAPFYAAVMPPSGAFNAFSSLAFFLTALAVILAWVELDFWPLSLIPPKAPAFGKQPIWGIVVSIVAIISAYIIKVIFVDNMGMDVFAFTVRVPISIIFGEFIMLLLLQTSPVQTMKQPGKGIILIILNIILAVVMYYLYRWFSLLIAGPLPSGSAAGYVQELWIATALLGFTFPVIAAYTGFFNFWPLTEPKPPAPPKA